MGRFGAARSVRSGETLGQAEQFTDRAIGAPSDAAVLEHADDDPAKGASQCSHPRSSNEISAAGEIVHQTNHLFAAEHAGNEMRDRRGDLFLADRRQLSEDR